jgi:hypothetical protein
MKSRFAPLVVAVALSLFAGGFARCADGRASKKGRLKVGGMWVKSLSALDQSGNVGPAASFSLHGSGLNVSSWALRAITPTFTFYDKDDKQLALVDTGWVSDSVISPGDSVGFWSPLLRYDVRFARVRIGFRVKQDQLAVDSGSVDLPEGVSGFLRLR